MNDLHNWLSQQHHGLRTFQLFRIKLANLGEREPGNAALYTLLRRLAGHYIEVLDEQAVPVAIADRAYGRLLKLLASLDRGASADDQLANLNRIATLDLLAPTSELDSYAEPSKPASRAAAKV